MDAVSAGPERTEDRRDGWRARLAVAATGLLGFLALSGVLIWVLPFGRGIQMAVLAHTAFGLAACVPVTWYAVGHWLRYRRHPMTYLKLLGYVGLFVLAVCGVTGLVVTWQAVFGRRMDPLWQAVHRWSTVAVLLLNGWHVAGLGWRDWRARADGARPLAASVRRFAGGSGAATLGPFAVVALALVLFRPAPRQTAFPPDYEMWDPKNPLYSDNRPFAPSLARTPGNQPIDPALLAGSKSCGTAGCHEQIVTEWQPSAHRYAAMDKAFQAIQLTMAKQNGPTSTRYCGGCHDPISLFSGAKNISASEEALTGLHGYQEGISCMSCHSVKQTDIRGNAQYTMAPPPRYIGELEYDATGGTLWRLTRDFLLRAYPAEHVASLSKGMFKKPEYCAACHKQFVDEEVNSVGWVQLQNQFDNWRTSKWARDRSDAARTVECRECHMPLVASTDPAAGDPADYNRSPGDGKHRSHRFLGANQFLPGLMKLEGGEEQVRLTHEWLQGKIAIPEISHKWAGTDVPAVSIRVVAPAAVRPGEAVVIRSVITSNKVGHDFPTGPLDIIQAWVEMIVRDDAGRVVFESGTVDERGFIKPGSFLFKAEPVDQYGNLIDRHNLWEMVGVRNRRSLFPGFADTAEMTFTCPPAPRTRGSAGTRSARGRLHVEVRLRYRKMDQFLLNYMRSVGFFPEFDGKPLTAPITDLHQDRAVVEVL
jgi:hypothetical protein